RCPASGGPKAIPLDQHVFRDLTDPMVISENTNRCSGVTASIALAADMTYQVEVQQPTAVAVQFHPVPNINGDQNSGMVSVENWFGMVYWREGECPTQVPPPQPSPSI